MTTASFIPDAGSAERPRVVTEKPKDFMKSITLFAILTLASFHLSSLPASAAKGITNMKTVNGWLQPSDLGRYGTDYDTRAGIAYVGLGADMPEDTIYPTAYVDGDGKPLDSANNYVLHFENGQLPPTNATWSVSQYQGNFYLPNAINRYAIAPWMPLNYNADGSLDVYLQPKSPGKDKEANWLPTPLSGPFNVTIRNYWPKKEALDRTYKVPPIKKLE